MSLLPAPVPFSDQPATPHPLSLYAPPPPPPRNSDPQSHFWHHVKLDFGKSPGYLVPWRKSTIMCLQWRTSANDVRMTSNLTLPSLYKTSSPYLPPPECRIHHLIFDFPFRRVFTQTWKVIRCLAALLYIYICFFEQPSVVQCSVSTIF